MSSSLGFKPSTRAAPLRVIKVCRPAGVGRAALIRSVAAGSWYVVVLPDMVVSPVVCAHRRRQRPCDHTQ
jgi:hypothetical protein